MEPYRDFFHKTLASAAELPTAAPEKLFTLEKLDACAQQAGLQPAIYRADEPNMRTYEAMPYQVLLMATNGAPCDFWYPAYYSHREDEYSSICVLLLDGNAGAWCWFPQDKDILFEAAEAATNGQVRIFDETAEYQAHSFCLVPELFDDFAERVDSPCHHFTTEEELAQFLQALRTGPDAYIQEY